jgi:hypothetical protein
MSHPQADRQRGESAMEDAPNLVLQVQEFPPNRRAYQRQERDGRGDGEAGSPRRLEHVQQRQHLWTFSKNNDGVCHHQDQGHPGDLPVEVVHYIHPVGRLDVAEPCGDQELHAHDGHAGESDRDRELRPETPARRRADQQEEQRRQCQQQIHADPKRALKEPIHPFLSLHLRSAVSAAEAVESPRRSTRRGRRSAGKQ